MRLICAALVITLAVKELHTLSFDFRDKAVLPLLVLVFASGQAAFDVNQASLFEVVRAVFGSALEA